MTTPRSSQKKTDEDKLAEVFQNFKLVNVDVFSGSTAAGFSRVLDERFGENIHFLRAVELLHHLDKSKAESIMSKEGEIFTKESLEEFIMKKFIEPGSDEIINISSDVRNDLVDKHKNKKVEFGVTDFLPAIIEIKNLISEALSLEEKLVQKLKRADKDDHKKDLAKLSHQAQAIQVCLMSFLDVESSPDIFHKSFLQQSSALAKKMNEELSALIKNDFPKASRDFIEHKFVGICSHYAARMQKLTEEWEASKMKGERAPEHRGDVRKIDDLKSLVSVIKSLGATAVHLVEAEEKSSKNIKNK